MPYNPGITDISGQLRARGMESLGDSLSGAITNIAQEKKQAKAMQAMFDAMTPEPDPLTDEVKPHPLGMNADQFKSMSWKDQIAKMGGFIKGVNVKSALQEVAQRRQQADQQKQIGNLVIAAKQGDQRAQSALARALQGAGQETIRTPTVPSMGMMGNPTAGTATRAVPVTLQSLLGQMTRPENAESVNAPQGDNLARILEMQERTSTATQAGAPELTNLGGIDTLFNRKTGQFQISPISKEEAKPDQDGHIELPDPDNPVFGPRIKIPLSIAEKKYPHLLKGLQAPSASAGGKGKPITDKKGKKWLYTGSANDPSTDRDPKNWTAQ